MTVRLPPHFCHSGRDFHGCRTEVGGGLRLSCGTLHQGPAAGKPSPTQILGILNNSCDDPNGGDGCLGHLPPYLVMHALCMQTQNKAGASNASSEDDERPTDQKGRTPKTRRRSRRGRARIQDIERPKIHTPPQPRPSAKSLWPFSGMIGIRVLQLRPLQGKS